MSKTRQEKRSKVKPFIKVINYNHLMPTRYTLELEGIKGTISADTFKEVSQREDAKKTVKKVLEERYTSGKNRWFFTPLSMFTIPGYPNTIDTTDKESTRALTNSSSQDSKLKIVFSITVWELAGCKEHRLVLLRNHGLWAQI